MNNIFKLNEINIIEPQYFMGIDLIEIPTYCLMQRVDGITMVVLAKSMHSEEKFREEVENLAKYFNAPIYQNGKFKRPCQ